MNAIPIIFAVSLCVPSVFARQPTLESLALKVEALEWKVEELKADIDASKKDGEGEADSDKGGRPEIIINLLKDGRMRVEGKELRDEELAARIEPILRKFPNQPIRIRADGEVKYQDVVRVIELCQRAGAWNLSFATETPPRPTSREWQTTITSLRSSQADGAGTGMHDRIMDSRILSKEWWTRNAPEFRDVGFLRRIAGDDFQRLF